MDNVWLASTLWIGLALPALILLATMILVNVVWRAAAEVTARVELMLMERGGGQPDSRRR